MRIFTDTEKEILRNLARKKEEGKLEDLQVAAFLKKRSNAEIIQWEEDVNSPIEIYTKDKDGKGNFFILADFLYFIDELVSNKLVEMPIIQSKKNEDNRRIFNREEYKYEDKAFPIRFSTMPEKGYYLEKKDGTVFVSPKKETIYNAGIVVLFEKYANAIIYPLPLLKDLVNNKFKDIEQRRFETQHRNTWIAIIVSIFIGVGSLLVSIFCPQATQTDKTEINSLQKPTTPIKTEFPQQIESTSHDSLKGSPIKH